MKTIRIEREDRDGKGRTFSAALLGYLRSALLWPQSDHDTVRPLWVAYATTPEEAKAFTANFRLGYKAKVVSTFKSGVFALELLKSAGYAFATQRISDTAVVTTAYLPQFFVLDPGLVDPTGIRFVVAPPTEWCQRHLATLGDTTPLLDHVRKARAITPVQHNRQGCDPHPDTLRRLPLVSSLFAAYLDRRTRAPLVHDPRFYLQLLVALLDLGAVRFPATTNERSKRDLPWGVAPAGSFDHYGDDTALDMVLETCISHEDFQAVLGRELGTYYRVKV